MFPPVCSTLPSNNLNTPWSVAVDGTSKVYIADLENSTVDQWLPGATNLTTFLDNNSFIQYPIGVAVDSAHNLFISDVANYGDVFHNYGDFEWVASSQSISRVGLGGMVVVGNGTNIYGIDLSTNSISRFDLSQGGVWVPVIPSGLNYPYPLATDKLGNLYFYNGGDGNFLQWNPASQALTPVNLQVFSPIGMTVDGANNFFIADSMGLKKWNAASQTFSTLINGTLNQSPWIPVGNIYFCGGLIYELPRAFVNPTAHDETYSASTDTLSAIVPATASLAGFLQTHQRSTLAEHFQRQWRQRQFWLQRQYRFHAPDRQYYSFGRHDPITQAGSPIGTPPFLINPQVLGDGSMQFNFTNLPGASLPCSPPTNLSLPLTNWTIAGAPTNIGPGLFQFTSAPLTNDPQRFYQVTSP